MIQQNAPEEKEIPADHVCNCLIVEDNYHAAILMGIFFERNRIASEIAGNGQIGLQMYLKEPSRYDAIFLDLQMPVMDGYEMVKKIRESGLPSAATVPIIAMSGTNTGDIVGEDGFDYFLKKPFELHSLLTVLDEVLRIA